MEEFKESVENESAFDDSTRMAPVSVFVCLSLSLGTEVTLNEPLFSEELCESPNSHMCWHLEPRCPTCWLGFLIAVIIDRCYCMHRDSRL